jgi:Cytochrome C'
MALMLADVDQIRGYVYGSATQADADKAAVDLVSWSQRMAELFPPGQASTDYVDMSPARVQGAPVAMQQSAQSLLSAVRTGKRAAVGDQLAQTERNGCGFCHLSGTR